MTISNDMKALAKAVLQDDVTAAGALVDLCAESWDDRERFTKGYLNRLEDTLQAFKHAIVKNTIRISQDGMYQGDALIRSSQVKALHSTYFKLEAEAKSLNRQGLS